MTLNLQFWDENVKILLFICDTLRHEINDKRLFLHIAVLTLCQMKKNPCSKQEIHMLFEHEFELENT